MISFKHMACQDINTISWKWLKALNTSWQYSMAQCNPPDQVCLNLRNMPSQEGKHCYQARHNKSLCIIYHTISQAPRITPGMTLEYLRAAWEGGSSTNSVNGFESRNRENSSPDGLQLPIDGLTPRNIRNPAWKQKHKDRGHFIRKVLKEKFTRQHTWIFSAVSFRS